MPPSISCLLKYFLRKVLILTPGTKKPISFVLKNRAAVRYRATNSKERRDSAANSGKKNWNTFLEKYNSHPWVRKKPVSFVLKNRAGVRYTANILGNTHGT